MKRLRIHAPDRIALCSELPPMSSPTTSACRALKALPSRQTGIAVKPFSTCS